MKRYIDAEEFKRILIDEKSFYPAIVKNTLENMPIADVIENTHAKWQKGGRNDDYWVCSRCGFIGSEKYEKPYDNFCGHCGAMMDLE